MLKTVCQSCEIEYRVKENGVYVVEYFSDPPAPYKIWSADTYECPKCGHRIVAGFGERPIAEHWEHDFDETLSRLRETETVIDDYER